VPGTSPTCFPRLSLIVHSDIAGLGTNYYVSNVSYRADFTYRRSYNLL